MTDLRDELREALRDVCLVGIGNLDLGDDGLGVRLAEDLRDAGAPGVLVAGVAPERHVEEILSGGFRSILLLDAVEFPGEPGSAVLLDAAALKSRFPQISTHKISLGTLARLIEGRTEARVRLLGVRPGSLAPFRKLSAAVEGTIAILRDLILELIAEVRAGAGPDPMLKVRNA